jgi:hypothetical protein
LLQLVGEYAGCKVIASRIVVAWYGLRIEARELSYLDWLIATTDPYLGLQNCDRGLAAGAMLLEL